MRKKQSKNRIFFLPILLILALSLILAGCGNSHSTGVSIITDVAARNIIKVTGKEPGKLHHSENDKSLIDSGISSGLIELWIDEATCSFGIYDTASSTLWTALPLGEKAWGDINKNTVPCVVSLRVLGGTDIYELNSQDNSLAYGKSGYEITENGVIFTYDIFANEETAKKEKYGATDIGFRAKLYVRLADGNMSVGCEFSNLTGNKNAFIEELEILNYFGAYNNTNEGDFLFVPDGCGAIIKTNVFDESFESLSFKVYGDDPSSTGENSTGALVPAFGMKTDKAAFAALIEIGDALATIKAEKATDRESYNRVYATFNITPIAYENESLYISKQSTVESVRLCYRFLSGINATYSGMACALREQLIRNGVLSIQSVPPMDFLPFYLSLSGVTNKQFGPLKYTQVSTDFDQAQDMIVRMKNKGINNITLRYSGIFPGGEDSRDFSELRILKRLGGKKGFTELYAFMNSQNMQLYANLDILTSCDGFKDEGSKNMFDEEVSVTLVQGQKPRLLRKTGEIKALISGILMDVRSLDFSGVCLGDAGSLLYSDFSKEGKLRQSASADIAACVTPLSVDKTVMVEKGNFYMLKNVAHIIELPIATENSKSGSYTGVPFLQLILHGIVDYCGEPINLQINSKQAMLRCLEFGACPHYKWSYISLDNSGTQDKIYYDNTINEASEFYQKATKALVDLRSARMTDHYEVQDGVFCTVYDNGAMIYVNYTSEDCHVLGVVVEAGSFLRVN